ncbi:hypothetical protein VNI00_014112 [Paramarasmius palmivorus]|uniref:Uncharacterized protein n=1 Tax=Paramarasmius palmivorus TaxID=297713 RepID=A0AAW0BUL1_9AGAR
MPERSVPTPGPPTTASTDSVDWVDQAVPQSVIIIEALDESDDFASLIEPLVLMSMYITPHLFKVIITSRPGSKIQECFYKSIASGLTRPVVLGDFDAREDIRSYLVASFNNIRSRNWRRMTTIPESSQWPSDEVVDRLMDDSAGLFIYASSIVHFVDHWFESPVRRLSTLLESQASISSPHKDHPYAPLDHLYLHILSIVQDYIPVLHAVIGSVMSLFVPLSIRDLSHLLAPRVDADQVITILERLSSILRLPSSMHVDSSEPTRIYHQSFRDFMFDERRSGIYHLNYSLQHAAITHCCFQLMSGMLQRNICQLPSGPIHVSMVPGAYREQRIPGSLRYACRFWAHHMLMCPVYPDEMVRETDVFVQKHLLHWIECMICIGDLAKALQTLRRIIDHEAFQDHKDILRDCVTFLLTFYHSIATVPLAMYLVALPACPLEALIRQRFAHELPPHNASDIPRTWDELLTRTIETRKRARLSRLVMPQQGHDINSLAVESLQSAVKSSTEPPVPNGRFPASIPAEMRSFQVDNPRGNWSLPPAM